MLKAAKVAKVSESSDAAYASIIAPALDPPASNAAAARGDVPTHIAEIKSKKMDSMSASVKVENDIEEEVHGAVCVKKQDTANQLFASVLGHHRIIALADFAALLTFEELHPNLFHRNRTIPSAAAFAVAEGLAARLGESCASVESGWIEEAAFQMHAFNLVFDDHTYGLQFKQIVKIAQNESVGLRF
jgi:hypothetical protein